MMDMFYSVLSNLEATRLCGYTWNVASENEELNFKLYFVLFNRK